MNKLLLSSFLLLVWAARLHAQNAPSIEWQKCLGGSGGDYATSVKETFDGGFIVAGGTYSNDGDVSGLHTSNIYDCVPDYWIVKLDSSGNIEWQNCLGGTIVDIAWSIQQTIDSGFIVAGTTNSGDGDVSGNHGVYYYYYDSTYGYTYYDSTYAADYWIVKLNSSGNIQWQKCLGGTNYEYAYSIKQTIDHGFILAGSSRSDDGDVSGHHGPSGQYPDYWIVKLDSSGNIQWQRSLGGTGSDEAFGVDQSTDGGFIVAGYTTSNDGDVSGYHGNIDYWIVKLDSGGNIQWQKCLGGSGLDKSNSIQQTFDHGFIVLGYSFSDDGDVSGNHGNTDFWVVKLDSSGNIQWQKSLGGSDEDGHESFGELEQSSSIQQIADGGFIMTGCTESMDGDVSGNHLGAYGYPSGDYWIVKLDSSGNLQWQKCLGGSFLEHATEIQQTTGGEFIVAGMGASNDGDVSGLHPGGSCSNFGGDYWIVKLFYGASTDVQHTDVLQSWSVFPNPASGKSFINYSLSTRAAVRIELYDLLGNKLKQLINAEDDAGEHNASFDASKLANGVYLLQIHAGNQMKSQKIIVMK
ncbi:MAG TPA: T9SS type A sorting domain-containing protein [Chitinophagales bacterium]|nr:T9SS type A sorting domain-containing protein [Chitinophagales bacterium]